MSPDILLTPAPKPSLFRVWAERFVFMLASGFLFIALLLMTSILWDTFYNSPPIRLTKLDQEPQQALCPGDHFDVHYRMEVTKPVFLYRYSSVMNPGLDYNIFGTQDSFTPMPQPKITAFEEQFPWQVPNLPPGEYSRVITFRGYNTAEKPAYMDVKFKVKEGCDEWDEQSNRDGQDSFNCRFSLDCYHGLLAFDHGATGLDLDLWYLYYQFSRSLFAEPQGNTAIGAKSR